MQKAPPAEGVPHWPAGEGQGELTDKLAKMSRQQVCQLLVPAAVRRPVWSQAAHASCRALLGALCTRRCEVLMGSGPAGVPRHGTPVPAWLHPPRTLLHVPGSHT